MADTSGISGYGTTISLVDILAEEREAAASDSTEQKVQTAAAAARKGKSAYAASASQSTGQAALSRALDALSKEKGGKITFADIADYQKDLQDEFSAKVRLGLIEKGLPKETDFTLRLAGDGSIEVVTKDPKAKELIQDFLKENPEACEDFGYIQALANFEKARKSPMADQWQALRDTKAAIQASAVSLFFSQAQDAGMNYASLMADFSQSQETAGFFTGVDYTV